MNETPTLKSLLTRALDKRQAASGRALAEMAENTGYRLAHTTVNAIIRGTYKSQPSNDTIRAIAWLAGVSDDVAFTAAGRRNPGPPFASELPPGVDDLSPTERRTALAVLRTLVAQRQEINRYEDTSTQTSTPRDPEAGSSSWIGASIDAPFDGFADAFGEVEIKALRNVRNWLAHSNAARNPNATQLIVMLDQVTEASRGKAADATPQNEGASVDRQDAYELARRKGETESEWRERTGNDYE